MISLGIAQPRRETRSYESVIVSALEAAATGRTTATGAATAALEAAARLYAAGFATADVKPSNARTAALTPTLLADVARDLIRGGESLHVIDVDPAGRVRLLRCHQWHVEGNADPAGWIYQCYLTGPSGSSAWLRPAEGVLHLRYATSAHRPWAGVGPLQWARETGRLTGALAEALADEAAGPRGNLLTVPDQSGAADDDDGEKTDPLAKLGTDLRALRGGAAMVESTNSGYGDKALAPQRDWDPRRLGAAPPAGLVSLAEQAFAEVSAACGIPPALMAAGPAAGLREALRTWYRAGLLPLARLIEDEARAKLESPDLSLGFRRLGAADIATSARAYRSMVEGGMDESEARGLAGLE